MAPTLYGTRGSPAVRASFLAIKALGINVEFKEVDMAAGEHLTPAFLKLNPLHTVPTLEDGNFSIWDSHVINTYLVGRYGKNDASILEISRRELLLQVLLPIFQGETKEVTNEELLIEAYGQLETLLEQSTYVAGETLTLADFSIVATVTSANLLVPIASNRFPKISAWLARIQKLPYYAEANQKGLDVFADYVKSKMA
ncbi:hypothetical protein NQ317_019154 [Molorchus minor]|uniref:Uncharacterized protein n=1 Tax=Molorchus minor TaxID=1323400 RepID=A0ABQ9JMW1_9CUCU|nr:hypothetical protein NQ317_019154 [Molorchus minor]